MARCLQPGFAFLLLAGSTGLCPSQAQYPLATDLFSALSAFNLSTSSPANAPVVEGLHRALGRGNMTGGLPPLTELNTLLAAGSPFRTSPLATLPQPPSPPPSAPPGEGTLQRTLTTPPSLPGNPSEVLVDSNLSDDLFILTTTLTVAQLIETQATLLSISYQFLTAAELQGTNLQVRMPLRIVAMELQSLAFAFGAKANHEQAEAAERAIAKRLQMEAAHDTPSSPGTMGTSTLPEGAELLAATLDPNLIYGTWQRLETSGPGQRIMYKIARDEWVKIHATTDAEGRRTIHTETHPGSVRGEITYTLPPDSLAPKDALSGVSVKVVIDKTSGSTMTLNFSFLEGAPEGDRPGVALDILVEQEGERKAFIRVA